MLLQTSTSSSFGSFSLLLPWRLASCAEDKARQHMDCVHLNRARLIEVLSDSSSNDLVKYKGILPSTQFEHTMVQSVLDHFPFWSVFILQWVAIVGYAVAWHQHHLHPILLAAFEPHMDYHWLRYHFFHIASTPLLILKRKQYYLRHGRWSPL